MAVVTAGAYFLDLFRTPPDTCDNIRDVEHGFARSYARGCVEIWGHLVRPSLCSSSRGFLYPLARRDKRGVVS